MSTRFIHISTTTKILIPICLGLVVVVCVQSYKATIQKYELKQARFDIENAALQLERVKDDVSRLQDENRRLEAAYNAYIAATSEATKQHESRIEEIETASDSTVWLDEPLPDTVKRVLCNASNRICNDGAAGGASSTLRDTDDGDNEHK